MLIPIFMYKLRWFNLCLSNLGKSTEIRDFVASIEIRNYKRHWRYTDYGGLSIFTIDAIVVVVAIIQ